MLTILSVGFTHRTEFPCLNVACRQHGKSTITVLRSYHSNHSHAHVEGLVHFLLGHFAQVGDDAENLSGSPGGTGQFRHQTGGDDASKVARESATSDMAEGVHIAFGGKRQAILGVDASRFEKFLPQGASEFFHIAIKRQLGFLQQNMARQ